MVKRSREEEEGQEGAGSKGKSLIYEDINSARDPAPLIISLDGNIGAGKSTLLEQIQKACPEYECILEPVGEWTKLKNDDGKSLLQCFYEDKKRWAYSFQNCAILTRIKALREAIRSTQITKKRIIITERSVLTDRYVFAEMLRDSGDLDGLGWALYTKWFDEFASDLPLRGIIYIDTSVALSAERIVTRGREGEGSIPVEYLTALEAQHEKWIAATSLPVCRVSTGTEADVEKTIASIRAFVGTHFPADAPTTTAAAGVATADTAETDDDIKKKARLHEEQSHTKEVQNQKNVAPACTPDAALVVV